MSLCVEIFQVARQNISIYRYSIVVVQIMRIITVVPLYCVFSLKHSKLPSKNWQIVLNLKTVNHFANISWKCKSCFMRCFFASTIRAPIYFPRMWKKTSPLFSKGLVSKTMLVLNNPSYKSQVFWLQTKAHSMHKLRWNKCRYRCIELLHKISLHMTSRRRTGLLSIPNDIALALMVN